MKKILAFLLPTLLILSLCACNNDKSSYGSTPNTGNPVSSTPTNTDDSPTAENQATRKCNICQEDAVNDSQYCKNHKCLVPDCTSKTKSYSVSRYCGKHTCMTDGCTRKAEDGSYFCWAHEQLRQKGLTDSVKPFVFPSSVKNQIDF